MPSAAVAGIEYSTDEQLIMQVFRVEFQRKFLVRQEHVVGLAWDLEKGMAVQLSQQRLSVVFQKLPWTQRQVMGVGLEVGSALGTRLQFRSQLRVRGFQKYLWRQRQVTAARVFAVFVLVNGMLLQFSTHSLEVALKKLGDLHMQLSVSLLVTFKSTPLILLQSISHPNVFRFHLKFLIHAQTNTPVAFVKSVYFFISHVNTFTHSSNTADHAYPLTQIHLPSVPSFRTSAFGTNPQCN